MLYNLYGVFTILLNKTLETLIDSQNGPRSSSTRIFINEFSIACQKIIKKPKKKKKRVIIIMAIQNNAPFSQS